MLAKKKGTKQDQVVIVSSICLGGAVALVSSDLGWSPRRGDCFVFLGKTLDTHNTSLHPGT